MSNFKESKVIHIHRERNMEADSLAKRSIEQELSFWKLDYVPKFVASTILDDIDGLARPNLISVTFAAS